jgi:hypothetical protein
MQKLNRTLLNVATKRIAEYLILILLKADPCYNRIDDFKLAPKVNIGGLKVVMIENE